MEAFIIEDCEFICSENAFCPLHHVPHRFGIILVCYFIIDGNVMFGIYRGLYIICYLSDIIADHYQPAFRIRKRDLWLSGFFQLILKILVSGFSFLLLVDLILYLLSVISIVFSQCPGIFFQLVIDIGYMPVYFCLVVIILLTVLSPQLGAVTGNKFPPDQVKMFCNLNSCPEYFLNGFWIVSAEIGNCVMIRFETL